MPKIGYLGAPDDHRENLVRLMAAAGNDICVMAADSFSSGVYSETPQLLSRRPLPLLWRRGYRIYSQVFGTQHPGYLAGVLPKLDEAHVACLLVYWGTGPIGDMIALKRHRPAIKLVLNVLCHPLGLSHASVLTQNWLFRRVMAHCDGLIVSSHAMREYLLKNVIRGRPVPCLLWPPYLSADYHPSVQLPSCPTVPNLLFLGRLDLAKAQPSDNVVPLLRELMDRGIHVYHHYSPESQTMHPNAHTFKYMSPTEIGTYATQFDASLVVYNLNACQRADRFDVTVPDRLVASVAAGTPIAIPANGYHASREYLRSYGGVLEFASAEDLATRLKDREPMKALRRAAYRDRERYVGESHVGRLVTFIHEVVNQRPVPAAPSYRWGSRA